MTKFLMIHAVKSRAQTTRDQTQLRTAAMFAATALGRLWMLALPVWMACTLLHPTHALGAEPKKSVKTAKGSSEASLKAKKSEASANAKTSKKSAVAVPDFIHRAQVNDTAESIAWKYLDQVQKQSNLQRFFARNGIAASAARKKIKPNTPIKIPVAWMFLKPESAVVLSASGVHSFAETEGAALQTLASGQALPEGSYLKTGAQGGVSVGLPDGSRAALPANSEVVLDTLRRYGQSDIFKIELKTLKGRVESSVKPLVHKAGSYEVKTRRSVTGVRGTTFNIEDNLDGNALVEVLEGAVELVDASGRKLAVIAGNGSYIEKSTAVKPLFLLDAPVWIGEGTDFVPADKVLPVIMVPGTQSVRVDVFTGNDLSVTAVDSPRYSRTGAQALLPADVPDGVYVLGIRSVDKNGLQGYPLRKEVRVTRNLLPPEVSWQVVTKKLTWRPTWDAKQFNVQLRKAGQTAGAPLLNQTLPTQVLDLSSYAPAVYEFRIASSDGKDLGPFTRWVSIVLP